jgi:hypothetical protein
MRNYHAELACPKQNRRVSASITPRESRGLRQAQAIKSLNQARPGILAFARMTKPGIQGDGLRKEAGK